MVHLQEYRNVCKANKGPNEILFMIDNNIHTTIELLINITAVYKLSLHHMIYSFYLK